MKRIHSGGEFEPTIGYCRAVVTDDGWVHVAGTCGREDENGNRGTTAAEQVDSALEIISDALTEAGASFADVVRVVYYLPDRREFAACWPALKAAFGENPPAATMIECGLITPEDRIEIEVTAKIGG